MAGPLGSQQVAVSPNALAQAVSQLIRRLDGGGLQGASNYLDSVGTTQTLPYAIGGAALGGLAGGALGGGVGALPGALTGAIGGNMIGQVLTGTSGILPTPPPPAAPMPASQGRPGAFESGARQVASPPTMPGVSAPGASVDSFLQGAKQSASPPNMGGQSLSGGSAPGVTAQSGATGPATGWTDAEAREITRATTGREMSIDEVERWVVAFAQEHNGQMPWENGPFTTNVNGVSVPDAQNNMLDHLMALGESEREVAMGGASDYTKQGREGNPMADAAITPDFWGDAYYSRYRGPTYTYGPGGPINMGDQYLMPGQLPPRDAALQLAYYGQLAPRPYYQYQPAMSPGEWQTPAPASGTSTGTGHGYLFQPTLYGVK